MKKVLLGSLVGAVLGMAAGTTYAEGVSINGFLTTSVARLGKADVTYLNAFTDEPRFDNTDSRLGLQFSGDINEWMSATAQVIARGRGGNENIITDWAFVSITANDDLQIRTGKLKFPTFLISDYYEVGYAYPWIRPPQELYSLNPITTLVGVDALYTVPVGKASLLLQPFVGSNRGTAYVSGMQAPAFSAAFAPVTFAAGDVINFDAPVLLGINAALNFDIGTLRAGYLQAEVDQTTFGILGEKADFASIGLTIDWRNVVVYAEFADRDVEQTMIANAFPDQRGGYVTLGYRFGRLLPHVTYASMDEGKDASALALKQTSTTVGLRYEFLNGAALKFEYQMIEPEDGNTGMFDTAVDDAALYGVSLDVIF